MYVAGNRRCPLNAMRRCGIAVCFLVCTAAMAACGKDLDPHCSEALGTYPFRYVGGAFGRGTLTTRPVHQEDNGATAIEVEVALVLDADEGPVTARLRSIGSCELAQIVARFPAVSLPDEAALDVLGGEFYGTLPRRERGGYGRWSAEIVTRRGATNTPKRIAGFWETRPERVADAAIDSDTMP